MKKILVFVFSVLYFTSQAQDLREYQYAYCVYENDQLPYRILYPLDFDTTKSYPLIVFLHGAGHKGIDNTIQLNIGGLFFLQDDNRKNFPAIVLFPQCPENQVWAYFETKIDTATGVITDWFFPFLKQPTKPVFLLKKLLDSLLGFHYIDRSRVYIGGLSQGGMGVYDMVARYPDLFAAAFPICGAGKVNTIRYFAATTALWIFHGDKDDVVPVSFSRDFYRRLKKMNADVRYSEYPGVFHDSWTNAFSEKGLLPWLFSKSKK